MGKKDIPAVALSNFDGDGPAAELEEGAEIMNVVKRSCYVKEKLENNVQGEAVSSETGGRYFEMLSVNNAEGC